MPYYREFLVGQRVLVTWSETQVFAARVLHARAEVHARGPGQKSQQTHVQVLYEESGRTMWQYPSQLSPLAEDAVVAANDEAGGSVASSAVWQPFELRCGLSRAVLVDPARTAQCNHPASCNFDSLRECVSIKRACPIAGCTARRLRSQDVIRDDAFRAALENLPPSTEQCWVRGMAELRVSPPPTPSGHAITGASSDDAVINAGDPSRLSDEGKGHERMHGADEGNAACSVFTDEQVWTWVQCDRCDKWRRLAHHLLPEVSGEWTCIRHPSGKLSCVTPEEAMGDDESGVDEEEQVEGLDEPREGERLPPPPHPSQAEPSKPKPKRWYRCCKCGGSYWSSSGNPNHPRPCMDSNGQQPCDGGSIQWYRKWEALYTKSEKASRDLMLKRKRLFMAERERVRRANNKTERTRPVETDGTVRPSPLALATPPEAGRAEQGEGAGGRRDPITQAEAPETAETRVVGARCRAKYLASSGDHRFRWYNGVILAVAKNRRGAGYTYTVQYDLDNVVETGVRSRFIRSHVVTRSPSSEYTSLGIANEALNAQQMCERTAGHTHSPPSPVEIITPPLVPNAPNAVRLERYARNGRGRVTDCPELGEGWLCIKRQRSTSSSRGGEFYKTFISPDGLLFKSMSKALHHLKRPASCDGGRAEERTTRLLNREEGACPPGQAADAMVNRDPCPQSDSSTSSSAVGLSYVLRDRHRRQQAWVSHGGLAALPASTLGVEASREDEANTLDEARAVRHDDRSRAEQTASSVARKAKKRTADETWRLTLARDGDETLAADAEGEDEPHGRTSYMRPLPPAGVRRRKTSVGSDYQVATLPPPVEWVARSSIRSGPLAPARSQMEASACAANAANGSFTSSDAPRCRCLLPAVHHLGRWWCPVRWAKGASADGDDGGDAFASGGGSSEEVHPVAESTTEAADAPAAAEAVEHRTATEAVGNRRVAIATSSRSQAGCAFELRLRPGRTSDPLCWCGRRASFLHGRYHCDSNICSRMMYNDRPEPERLLASSVMVDAARATASLLTASAYGPMNSWGFVAPTNAGLGVHARVPLVPGQFVCEYAGPRLPARLHQRGDSVLEVPGSNLPGTKCKIIIDGASESEWHQVKTFCAAPTQIPHPGILPIPFHVTPPSRALPFPPIASLYRADSPFLCPRALASYANHSRRPNARLEAWPVLKPGACELGIHMMLVASEHIESGGEIRIDYEDGGSQYWRAIGQHHPVETEWRSARQCAPPPTGEEPIVDRLVELRMAAALGREANPCSVPTSAAAECEPVPWEGPAGGDARLRAVTTLLADQIAIDRMGDHAWALAATHVPGRTGRECRDRWRRLTGQRDEEQATQGGRAMLRVLTERSSRRPVSSSKTKASEATQRARARAPEVVRQPGGSQSDFPSSAPEAEHEEDVANRSLLPACTAVCPASSSTGSASSSSPMPALLLSANDEVRDLSAREAELDAREAAIRVREEQLEAFARQLQQLRPPSAAPPRAEALVPTSALRIMYPPRRQLQHGTVPHLSFPSIGNAWWESGDVPNSTSGESGAQIMLENDRINDDDDSDDDEVLLIDDDNDEVLLIDDDNDEVLLL